jgi:hypothetical protein
MHHQHELHVVAPSMFGQPSPTASPARRPIGAFFIDKSEPVPASRHGRARPGMIADVQLGALSDSSGD